MAILDSDGNSVVEYKYDACETGIDVATSLIGQDIKDGTQNSPKKKTVYDPLLGIMREIEYY